MLGETAFLVPGENLLVRDPVSKTPLAAKGEVKPLIGPEGRYWRRRIRDGSVTIKDPLVETGEPSSIKKGKVS